MLTPAAAPRPQPSETIVKRADAPRLLEYNWGDKDLRWQLEPAGNGTRLTLWHNIDRPFIAWGAAGWHICFDVLDRLLAGDPIGRMVGADAVHFAGWKQLNYEYAKRFGIETPPARPTPQNLDEQEEIMESTLHNPAVPVANTTLRSRTILYWTMTVLVALPIGSGGVGQIAQYFANPHGTVPQLGYPMYFFAILGFWKVLGAITILAPRFPLLKEWAYAGIFFDLTGAAASCAWVGGYGAYDFHVLAPLILTGFTVASWALRPDTRKITNRA